MEIKRRKEKLFNAAAANADVILIQNAILSAANGSLRGVEKDFRLARIGKKDGRRLQRLTVANTRKDASPGRNGVGDEVERLGRQFIRVQFGDFSLVDVEDVIDNVFFDDVPGGAVLFALFTAHAESFMLTDGVVVDAFVRADNFFVESTYLPLFHRDVGSEEGAEVSFADKAHAGGVLLFGVRKTVFFGKLSNGRFWDVR